MTLICVPNRYGCQRAEPPAGLDTVSAERFCARIAAGMRVQNAAEATSVRARFILRLRGVPYGWSIARRRTRASKEPILTDHAIARRLPSVGRISREARVPRHT